MSVSNSSNFTQTRDQIISDALITLGVYRPGATISTNDYNICSNWLNKIVKAWDTKGIHMWSEVEGTLFLRNGVNKYTLSSSSTDKAGNDVIETTLTAAASSTSLTVSSTVGMTAADNIGIELDDNTRQWTTIVSVDSSTALTVTAAVTSTASSGNTIFTFTNQISKPIHISSCRFRNISGTDKPIYMRGRDEFMNIPSKDTTGSATNQCFYATGRDEGTMYVWPTPDQVSGRVKFSYVRMLYDFDSSSDNADFPSEWLETITLNLMHRVSGIYGKSLQERQLLKQEAQESLIEMQLWDLNNGSSIRIVPGYRDDL